MQKKTNGKQNPLHLGFRAIRKDATARSKYRTGQTMENANGGGVREDLFKVSYQFMDCTEDDMMGKESERLFNMSEEKKSSVVFC